MFAVICQWFRSDSVILLHTKTFPTVSDHTSTLSTWSSVFCGFIKLVVFSWLFFCFCSPWGLFYSKELHTWLNSLNIRVNVVQIKPQFKHFMLFLVTSFFKNTNGRHPSIDVPKSSIVLYSTFGNILILGLFLAKVLGLSQIFKAGLYNFFTQCSLCCIYSWGRPQVSCTALFNSAPSVYSQVSVWFFFVLNEL